MAVSLVSVTYTPQNVTGTTDHLVGNIFQQIECSIVVRVEAFIIPNDGVQVLFGDPAYQTPDYITDEGGRFTDFNVGDTIENENIPGITDGTYKIIEKVNNFTIRVSDTLGGSVVLPTYYGNDGVIRLVDEPKAISYDFGFAENDEISDFTSKIDGILQRYELSDPTQIDLTFSPAVANGKKSWQFSNYGAEIRRVSSDNTLRRYDFEIKHIIRINPWFLLSQTSALQNGIAPSYYDLFKCLKHAYRIRSYRSSTEPNYYQELVVSNTLGNTGWTSENFNGNPPQFRFLSVAYNNTINSLEVDQETDFTIQIEELAAPVKFAVVNFIILPEDDSEYANIDEYMDFNYLYDRAEVSVGGGPANGEKFGGAYQVFKNVSVSTSTGTCTVTGTVDFGSTCQAVINAKTFKRFWIAVEVLSDDQNAPTANNVVIGTGIKSVSFDIPESSLVTEVSFLRHDINDIIDGDEFPILKTEEETVGNVGLVVDTAGFDSLLIDSVSVQIIGKSLTQQAILQQYDLDLTGLPVIDGARFVNVDDRTQFNVIDEEIRSAYQLKREPVNDSGTQKAYRLVYPFIFRWEYYRQLLLNSLPSDLFDVSQPFNGYNHNWNRIGDLSGWGIYFRLVINLTGDGLTKTFVRDSELEHRDYNANPDWINETIKIYDLDGNELTANNGFGIFPYIKSGEIVKVVATFESTVGDVDVSKTVAYSRIYPQEGGSHIDSQSFSSIYDREEISLFTSNGGNGLIQLSAVGPILTCEFYADGDKVSGDSTISVLIDSPVQIGLPVETIEAIYTNETWYSYSIQLSTPTPGATFIYSEEVVAADFDVESVTFNPAEVVSVEFSVNGASVSIPFSVLNGDTLGYLVNLQPGVTSTTITIN
jgi:hypothetical protein